MPNISAAIASNLLIVGSSPKTSSPTDALNIAVSIAGVGMVKVSDLKSVIILQM